MAIIAATVFSVSAQKSITNVPCNADKVVKWWNNKKAPHSNEETKDEERNDKGNFYYTSQTEFYLYIADKEKATGQAVVICPGGGYRAVCIEREGFKLAEYFKSIGVTALVLKYRLPNYGHKEVPLEDAQAALAYLRKNAKKLGFDPKKVGIAGSSAGGHLAAYTSTFTPDAEKPAFSVLFYPVITGDALYAHKGSFDNLLGSDRTAELTDRYSAEKLVSEKTPATFMALSDDDGGVPPANSIRFYNALKAHNRPASIHIYPSGGHGWGFRDSFKYKSQWQQSLLEWLEGVR